MLDNADDWLKGIKTKKIQWHLTVILTTEFDQFYH